MNSATRRQRRSDHRLQELVSNAKNVDVAIRLGVPRSTARGWLAPTAQSVVTLGIVDQDVARLPADVLALRKRVEFHMALLRLMKLLIKSSDCTLARVPLPEGAAKEPLLRAIDRASAKSQQQSRKTLS